MSAKGALRQAVEHAQASLANEEHRLYWTAAALALLVYACTQLLARPKKLPENFPPLVKLSKEEIFNDPIASYSRAVREHGGVIAVKKKDKVEIVVDQRYVTKVLTEEPAFNFEHGVADALNFNFLMGFEVYYFRLVADVVEELLQRRIDIVVPQVSSIFFERARQMANAPGAQDGVDFFKHCQSTVSDAMIVLLLGRKFLNRANGDAIMLAANDVATLGGIYQNRSWYARTFPALWRATTFLHVVIVRICFGLMLFLGRPLWREMTALAKDPQTYDERENVSLLLLLVRRFAADKKKLSLKDRGLIYMVLIGVIFASVHQVASTMVWVLAELALRPEHQADLVAELKQIMPNGSGALTHDDLKHAVRADSFIREVMRTKGDTFSVTRMTTRDVQLGQYIIPKGYPVYPNAFMAHNDPTQVGAQPEEFDGKRWLTLNKPAAMTGTGNLTFGLGRWACPGRFLAVAEIKMMVFSILGNAEVALEGNKYEIVDKLLIASAPPEGKFLFTPRKLQWS